MNQNRHYTLIGVDGNAVAVMVYVKTAMCDKGKSKVEIDTYLEEAQSGDYDNLLRVSQRVINALNSEV